MCQLKGLEKRSSEALYKHANESSELRLMLPGPAQLSEEVLCALANSAPPHYGSAWESCFARVTSRLKELFETKHDVLIVPGPGSLALEMGLGSLVRPGRSVAILSNGYFGERLCKQAECLGIRVWKVTSSERLPIDSRALRKCLARLQVRAERLGEPLGAICVVHLETNTGVVNPVEDIAHIAHDIGLPIIVDAIGSLGGVELKVDLWGIDYCVGVPNKCLAAPAGLALVSVSPQAWSIVNGEHANRGWYTSLATWDECKRSGSSPTGFPYPTTLPTNLIVALDVALRSILRSGISSFRKEMAQAAATLRRDLQALGFPLYIDEHHLSPVVSTFLVPTGSVASEAIDFLLQHKNLMIANGLGPLREKVVRIGHFGLGVDATYIQLLAGGLSDFLTQRERCWEPPETPRQGSKR